MSIVLHSKSRSFYFNPSASLKQMSIATSKDQNLDKAHVAPEEPGPDPLTETQDGLGVLEGHSQQTDAAPEEIGGQAERDVKTSKVTLGRHVTSAAGAEVSAKRHNQFVRP